MPKKYDLSPELGDLGDMTDLTDGADMHRGDSSFMVLRGILMVGGLWFFLISAAILIYKFVFARENNAWWLIAITVIACLFLGWLLLRVLIRFYLQLRLKDDLYDWRPAGVHLMMNSGQAVFEGEQDFKCPHCARRQHTFKIHLTRLHGGHISYLPTLLDPVGATSIVYHRQVRLPLTCPTTGKVYQGSLLVDQCSKDAVVQVEVITTLK